MTTRLANIRVDEDEYARWQAAAARDQRTFSQWARIHLAKAADKSSEADELVEWTWREAEIIGVEVRAAEGGDDTETEREPS
jgi:hypothetical protein